MDQDSYLAKQAAHADDRLRERTKAHPAVLHELRKKLRRIKLERGTHHARIPGGGYAVLKDIGDRHVVATVLASNMNPPGKDVSQRLRGKRMLFKRAQLIKMADRIASQIGPVKPPAQTVTVKGIAPPPPASSMGGVPNAPPVKPMSTRSASPTTELGGMPNVTSNPIPSLPPIQSSASLKPQVGSNVDAVIKKASRLSRFMKAPRDTDSKPDWFPKAILAGAVLGGLHGVIRPHSAFSGGIEQGKITLKNRLAGGLVGSTVGAGLGWMPQIVYEGLNGKD